MVNTVKLKFFKENVFNIFKEVETYQSFNKDLASFLLKELIKINFENVDYNKSVIEVDNDLKNGYLYLLLVSKSNNVSLQISLFKDFIEMYVEEEGYPVYDSYRIKSSNVDEVKRNLQNWISKDIFRETLYYKDNVKKDTYSYIESDGSKHILHKTESLNYIFRKGELKTRKYTSWIC